LHEVRSDTLGWPFAGASWQAAKKKRFGHTGIEIEHFMIASLRRDNLPVLVAHLTLGAFETYFEQGVRNQFGHMG